MCGNIDFDNADASGVVKMYDFQKDRIIPECKQDNHWPTNRMGLLPDT